MNDCMNTDSYLIWIIAWILSYLMYLNNWITGYLPDDPCDLWMPLWINGLEWIELVMWWKECDKMTIVTCMWWLKRDDCDNWIQICFTLTMMPWISTTYQTEFLLIEPDMTGNYCNEILWNDALAGFKQQLFDCQVGCEWWFYLRHLIKAVDQSGENKI